MCVGGVGTFIGFVLPWGDQKLGEFRESCFLIVKGSLSSHESSTFQTCFSLTLNLIREKVLYITERMYFHFIEKKENKRFFLCENFLLISYTMLSLFIFFLLKL